MSCVSLSIFSWLKCAQISVVIDVAWKTAFSSDDLRTGKKPQKFTQVLHLEKSNSVLYYFRIVPNIVQVHTCVIKTYSGQLLYITFEIEEIEKFKRKYQTKQQKIPCFSGLLNIQTLNSMARNTL